MIHKSFADPRSWGITTEHKFPDSDHDQCDHHDMRCGCASASKDRNERNSTDLLESGKPTTLGNSFLDVCGGLALIGQIG